MQPRLKFMSELPAISSSYFCDWFRTTGFYFPFAEPITTSLLTALGSPFCKAFIKWNKLKSH